MHIFSTCEHLLCECLYAVRWIVQSQQAEIEKIVPDTVSLGCVSNQHRYTTLQKKRAASPYLCWVIYFNSA